MSEKFPLHDLLSPMNREERLKVQENWMRIKAYLNSLQTQILMLAGGTEIDELLERINEAIESSETTAVEVNTLLEQMNSVLTEMETATSDSVETRDQLIVLKNDLETLQTSLNTAINREAERVSNENTRVSNENARINAENEREADEQNRISAETARIDNESVRINAENSRVSEESTRVTNENARQESHEQLLELLQNIKSEEYDAAKTYNFPNFVTRNGETFIALKTVTGVIPVDDGINYRLFAKRGLDGQGSVSSVNGELPDANGNVQIEISNPTEILDLLTSERTDAALSAKQGMVLNESKVSTSDKATIAEAEAGTNDTKWMTPLKTTESTLSLFGSLVATQTNAVAGTANDKIMTPLRVSDVTGKLSALQTTNKTNIVQAVNEVKNDVTQHLEQKATLTTPGHVKPDGDTLTVDENGTIMVVENVVDFYDNGDEVVPWRVGFSSGTGSQSKNSDNLQMTASGIGSARYYVTNNSVDMSNYKKIRVEVDVLNADPFNADFQVRLGTNGMDDGYQGGYVSKNTIGRGVIEMNVLNVNTNMYIKVLAGSAGSNTTANAKVYRVLGVLK